MPVSGNRLSVLSDNSLYGLPHLSLLDISQNQLSALPPTIFRKSTNLQKLFLQNNSLSLLSSEVFSGLENLLLLNISHNDISSHLLSDTIFSGLQKLVALDLSHNALTKLESRVLEQQNNLQILNLNQCSPKLLVKHSWAIEGHDLLSLELLFMLVFLRVCGERNCPRN